MKRTYTATDATRTNVEIICVAFSIESLSEWFHFNNFINKENEVEQSAALSV